MGGRLLLSQEAEGQLRAPGRDGLRYFSMRTQHRLLPI